MAAESLCREEALKEGIGLKTLEMTSRGNIHDTRTAEDVAQAIKRTKAQTGAQKKKKIAPQSMLDARAATEQRRQRLASRKTVNRPGKLTSKPVPVTVRVQHSQTPTIHGNGSSAAGKTVVWFGKHKGRTLSEIPIQYLQWCLSERAGGGELVEAIAAYLGVEAPKKQVPYAGKTITREELVRPSQKPGFTQINAFCDGVDIMGVANCYDRFDAERALAQFGEPDQNVCPFDDVSESDREFREMFG